MNSVSLALPKPLSPQQRIVMQHLVDGLTLKEIAGRMGIKIGTIRKYMRVVREKTGLRTTYQLIAFLVACGELTVQPANIIS